jgi:mono/diheme cytochrome c family protein
MRTGPILFTALLAVGLVACGESDTASDAPQPTPADTVETALAQYDPTAYDSISWETADDALERGRVVFSFSCRKCHGTAGYGDGGFVMQGDTLRPPSFHDPEWELRDDLEGLRRQVYIGTTEGMPHWGLEGLTHRDIDAVARYIQSELTGE